MAPCVEGHGQALARPLGVPDDPDAAVAGIPTRLPPRLVPPGLLGDPYLRPLQFRRPQGLAHCDPHSVELVVTGHLLDQRAAPIVLEHDEIADQ